GVVDNAAGILFLPIHRVGIAGDGDAILSALGLPLVQRRAVSSDIG
ncbi:MAG: hypothetical protein QOC66_1143, partial [Pseudonocardiales bacterium]|nr:hypothetical protein [Pseudonocardiales bacterium]